MTYYLGSDANYIEVFHMSAELLKREGWPASDTPGWYWWRAEPGQLPDDEPSGPFKTEAAALENAGIGK